MSSKPIKSWHDSTNADKYHEFGSTHTLYREAATRLAELASIQNGESVLELACGTGVSTQAIAEVAPAKTEIVAQDFSLAQVQKAKSLGLSEYIEFRHSPDGRLEFKPDESFDVVLCSAAFWYLDIERILAELVEHTSARSRLVFNILAGLLPNRSKRFQPIPVSGVDDANTPGILETAVQIAKSEFGYTPESHDALQKYDTSGFESRLDSALQKVDFEITREEPGYHEQSFSEGVDWYRVPVLMGIYYPDLDYDIWCKSLDLAEQAYEGLRLASTSMTWVNFVARRKNGSI